MSTYKVYTHFSIFPKNNSYLNVNYLALKNFNLLLSAFMTKIETGTAVNNLKILGSFKFILDE